MYTIMKRYLKPEENGCLSFIMVPDQEKFKTKCQEAVTKCERTGKMQMRDMIILLYHYIQDEKNGLTKLLPHKRVVVKEEMEKYLLEHHQRHFSQATPTPFAQAPLKDLIGYSGEGPLAQEPKEGIANVDKVEVDQHTKDVLHELQWQPHFPPKVSDELNWHHVQHGFKIWNENTSTSPMGRYLGKYKVWIENTRKEEEHHQESKSGNSDILSSKEFFTVIS